MTDKTKFSPIEEIIAEAQAGRMFILVDDEDRENEGDLVIPAQFADAKAVNFMATHGRGLICLTLDKARIGKLDLPLMAYNNKSRHQTAFTVSIEAREGISTGISAEDRAKTIAVAIDANKTKYDIVSPGHIFPLAARDGGVLVRAGHTEAAVDISKMAGLNPSGVICEIMNDDGTMARVPDLLVFAKKHNLKIATIADLIEYRRSKEKLVERVSEAVIKTEYAGEFKAYVYRSKLEFAEHLALVKGDINEEDEVLVRMHQMNVISDVLEAEGVKNKGVLKSALMKINEKGQGVAVILRSPNRQSLSEVMAELNLNKSDAQVAADKKAEAEKNKKNPQDRAIRDYGIGAQILTDIGVRKMKLLSRSGVNVIALEGYGLSVVGNEVV